MLAHMVSEEKLGPKKASVVVRFLVAAPVLFIEWAAYGLFALPALKRVFASSSVPATPACLRCSLLFSEMKCLQRREKGEKGKGRKGENRGL